MKHPDMKLSDFIAASLDEVVAGVYKGRKGDNGHLIAPSLDEFNPEQLYGLGFACVLITGEKDKCSTPLLAVDFDVAIKVSEINGGKIGINIMPFKAAGEKTGTTENVSRMKFKIPLALPPQVSHPKAGG